MGDILVVKFRGCTRDFMESTRKKRSLVSMINSRHSQIPPTSGGQGGKVEDKGKRGGQAKKRRRSEKRGDKGKKGRTGKRGGHGEGRTGKWDYKGNKKVS